ncbi:EF-hand domain-containing protein [Nonomuraea insulae]|uniref:EF-hand domain-containing protein n=1 Tax=Nonomuraea insulae TaxID=1616787 RepID=A0ABW1CLE7_9ACTN
MSMPLTETNLALVFAALDTTGDGRLSAADFITRADQMCAALAPDPSSASHQSVQQGFAAWWEHLRAGADVDQDGSVSSEEYLATAGTRAADTGEDLARVVLALAGPLFDAADTDGDGTISRPEYVRFYTALNLDGKIGEDAFTRLDIDGDGSISQQEFFGGIRAIFTSNDPGDPGTWMLGGAPSS